jgi:hypothetical protein
LQALLMGLVLGWGVGGLEGSPAYAQGCLAPGDIRSAARAGRVMELSKILGQLGGSIAGQGGQVLSLPQLCNDGDRLIYQLNVLGRGGKLRRFRIDAQNGNVLGR